MIVFIQKLPNLWPILKWVFYVWVVFCAYVFLVRLLGVG